MGGCRCSFRSCDISTASMPGTHFFHFPVRFPERCRQWAELAEKVHFLELPNDKLKNKVVCQYHFKEKCFMNYKRDSLTKTAVPTLMVDGGVEFDIMVNTPTNEIPLVDVVGPIVKKRPFSEVIKQEPAKKIRIITNERLLNSQIPPPPQEPEEPQFTVYNSDNFEPQQDIVTGSIVENGNKIVLKRNQVDLIDLVEDSFQKVINNQNTQIKDLKKSFDDTLKEVIGQTKEIKSRISEIKESSSSTPSEPKPEKSLNKVQLFNSVKRYLNPTMVTLLRMDMFGGSDREWKEDEKQFALELKELGDNVYDHMRDEWRFRLPSKKQLVEWASKEQSLKDEEDP